MAFALSPASKDKKGKDMKTLLSFFILPALFVACGKSGTEELTASTQTHQSSYIDSKSAQFQAKFLDEDLYYTLSRQGIMPQLTDSRYIDFNVFYSQEKKELNHQIFEKGLRHLKIIALDLKLGGADSHDVYHQIKRTFDVETLEIIARDVVVSDKLHIAGGNVIIKAENITFKGVGQIKTTPEKASGPAAPFTDGEKGLDAGNITLLFENLHWDREQKQSDFFLIANGGEGQDAGFGADGINGRNINAVKAGAHIYYSERQVCRLDSNHPRQNIIELSSFVAAPAGLDCYWKKDQGRPSTSGEDAKQGGQPGLGGMPGAVVLSQSFSKGIQNIAGLNGKEDIIRVGGKAGMPKRICKLRIHHGRKGSEEFGCLETQKGKDALPKVVDQSYQKGEIKITNESFVTGDFLRKLSFFASDVYKENYIDYAKNIYENIEKALLNFSEKDISALEASHVVSSNLMKIAARKDYYGHEKKWIPNLAFETTYKIFEKEMKNNLRNFYYARILKKNFLSLEEKKNIITKLQQDLYADIEEKRNEISQFLEKTENIKVAIKNVEVSENEFQFELKKLEDEFYAQARSQLEVPFFKKAVKVLSVAAKAIPVGQPTFGAIGVGLDILDQATDKKVDLSNILTTMKSASKDFESFDWKDASRKFESKVASFDPDLFINANSNKERIAYLREVGEFTAPIYDAISNQIKSLKSQEVSSSKLDAMILKLKQSDARYQKVIDALEKLLTKKQTLVTEFENFNLGLLKGLEKVRSNYSKISELSFDNQNLILFDVDSFSTVLAEIEKNSLERLGYYHYLFTKSYEYRFLTPYKKSFSHESLTYHVDKFVSLDNPIENQIEALFLFYKAELSDIAHNIVSGINELGVSHIMSTYINLTLDEEAALNNGEEVFVDLRNIYDEEKEDIRLSKIQLTEAHFSNSSQDNFELKIQHSGTSLIERNGKTFIFGHENVKWPNLTWISYKGSGVSEIQYSEENRVDRSLFTEIFGIREETRILTQPGAKTFVSLKLNKDKKQKISNMKLRVDYSFKL